MDRSRNVVALMIAYGLRDSPSYFEHNGVVGAKGVYTIVFALLADYI
jgi:hypothetical protein